MAVTDGGRCRSGQSPPPLAGLDLASRGLASAPTATAAAAATALKSSTSPGAELQHRQHHHPLSRDHKKSADRPPGPYAEGHRKSSASPPAACLTNASHAEVKKLRERYFDDAAAIHGLGSSERGYGIGKQASTLAFFFSIKSEFQIRISSIDTPTVLDTIQGDNSTG